ncbi:uncharacterized protein BP01DRAFT_361451 [Aspergillus saccharolyticus JOP 1030-1]|uniref:Uncharacterized protein n=1 Tax=Aspergillus saccharolyticus JOP 1030-1 TaxID=1450539 RepID=A0A318Z633_9EURO|nr:hypothetical protein BP01DRAFT_361451 [Aspergillus saccharolyticus JOP 1030-1]PYH40223.1 hypothetical protein BP01DRAFT_361451 [Aspergillus saccharolyticus JOP 1030-1]
MDTALNVTGGVSEEIRNQFDDLFEQTGLISEEILEHLKQYEYTAEEYAEHEQEERELEEHKMVII